METWQPDILQAAEGLLEKLRVKKEGLKDANTRQQFCQLP